MKRHWIVKLHKFLILLTVIMVSLMTAVVWFFPSNDDFRTGNPFWNGTKDIESGYAFTPLESLSGLPASPHDAVLVIIPYLRFSAADLDAVSGFITGGGTVIVADDYGYGNQITEFLGLRSRFSGQPLLDPIVNYKNQWFPKILHIRSSSLTTGIDELVLNHATALSGIEAGDILARSSIFSFVDTDGDRTQSAGETTGLLPVISRHRLGNGIIILISDPSLLINSMTPIGGNDRLAQNIAAAGSTILLDQSHLPSSNLSEAKDILTQLHNFFTTLPGTLGLVLAVITVTLMPIWHRRR